MVLDMLIFICDDEEMYRNQIYDIVLTFIKHNNIKGAVCRQFATGEQVLASDEIADIAILDVEMPDGMKGTEVGRLLKEKNPDVKILITSHHISYIDDAFRFSFYRFLPKPINRDNLERNLLEATCKDNDYLKEIVVRTKFDVTSVTPKEIILLSLENRSAVLHTVSRNITSTLPLSHFEAVLPDSHFFRTHRDFIVNMDYVSSFDYTTINLKYKNMLSYEAYLSRRKYTNFRNHFLWFKEKMV